MTWIDARDLPGGLRLEADVVIVGSGPAGSATARELARGGARVVVLEAGPRVQPGDFELSAFGAMSTTYRDAGAAVVLGAPPMPLVQGRMVGGSSPINGAICWRLPQDVWAEWVEADPALAEALPWSTIEDVTDAIEHRLGVAPTDASVAGRKNQLMAKGAEALGLEHRPIRRNVLGCRGLGRCMQGCPGGHKQSVDRTLLADAVEAGATVVSSAEVRTIQVERGRAVGVVADGVVVRAGAVALAASAVQSPGLLLANGIGHGPVGRNFQCHPGVSMAGRFAEPVRMWQGATQGHEVTGLRREGLKFEVLGFGPGLLAARLPGIGRELAARVDALDHWLDWGVAIRATARGRVRRLLGRTVVQFTPSVEDVQRFRRGLRVLGELLFAAGAERVAPSVRGLPGELEDPAALVDLEQRGPDRASAYTGAITHLFGTCRMGSDARESVVGPDFAHHGVERLWVADSSVFPTNLGVNPQIAIMALATLCGRRILEAEA